jgi:hypothetical protein
MHWQDSDLSLFPADVVSRRREIEAKILTLSSNMPNGSSSSINPGDLPQQGLTLRARIGIGVGVTFGLLLVLSAIGVWIFKVRRRRQIPPVSADAKELDASNPVWKRFLGAKWRAELTNGQQTAELPATDNRPGVAVCISQKATQIPVELQGSDQWHNANTYSLPITNEDGYNVDHERSYS